MVWPTLGSTRLVATPRPRQSVSHRARDGLRAACFLKCGVASRAFRALLTAAAVALAGCAQLAPSPGAPVPTPVAAVPAPLQQPPSEPRKEPMGEASPPVARAMGAAPFFPIGIFSVPPGDVAHARSLGFNLVHTYRAEGSLKEVGTAAPIEWLQDYLRAAEAAGVGVMLGLPRRAIIDADQDEMRRRIEQLRGSPALRVWYLFDEPEIGNVPASAVGRAAELIDEADGTRPRVLVLAQRPQRVAARGYLDVGDVIMVDPYPYVRPDSDISSVYRHVAEAALLTKGRRQVWATIQAHGRGPGGRGFGLLEPPFQELRNMTFQALAGGASGIFFFCYECGQFELTRTPRGLENVSRLVGEIHSLSALLLSQPPSRPPVRVTAAPGVVYRTFEYDGFLWLLVVNTARAEMRFSAGLHDGTMPAQISIPAEKRSVSTVEGRLDDVLRPLDVRVYQMPLP